MTIRAFEPKDADEVDFWNIDFSDRMPASDSITAIVSVTFLEAPDAALLLDQTALSGKVVSGRWQAGTRGATYVFTARVTTAQGRTLDKSGSVFVTDT